MDDKTISFIYINVYCILLFVVEILMVLYHHELESTKGMVNVFLDLVALIAVLGYAYERKTVSKHFWMTFAMVFFLWEVLGYAYLDSNPFRINVMILIMLGPLYWGVALYPLLTLEEDETKKIDITAKRDRLKERFKGLMVMGCTLSLLFLFLCLTVLIRMA